MKKKTLVVLLIVICVLSGCQNTPTTTVTNNHKENTTYGQAGEEITEEGTTESLEDMTVVNITTEDINESFQVGNKTITFKGTISIPDRTDGLYTYRATETDYDEYFGNMDFLFGKYEENVYEDKLFEYMKHASGEDGYQATINNTRAIEGDATGPTIAITFDVHPNPIVSDDKIKANMTNEEAREKADEIVSRIGVKGFEFNNYSYVEAIPQKIFRDEICVRYKQFLQGVPVAFHFEEYMGCGMSVSFSSRGTESVYIIEYDFERLSRNHHCLTYEEALEYFKTFVESCDYYEKAVFDSISFQYVLKGKKVDNRDILIAVPCWRFDTILEPSLGNDYPDIFVDATNGEIYSMPYIE